jgi:hypothetical protein
MTPYLCSAAFAFGLVVANLFPGPQPWAVWGQFMLGVVCLAVAAVVDSAREERLIHSAPEGETK